MRVYASGAPEVRPASTVEAAAPAGLVSMKTLLLVAGGTIIICFLLVAVFALGLVYYLQSH